jgi:hypothetical protein
MCIQVGKIYEMIGDATEAVAYFQSGKEIANSVKSPSFVGVFASMLGICVTFFISINFYSLIVKN